MPAIDDGTAVDRHQLALTDDTLVRDAVDDFVVQGDADRVREWTQRAGHPDERGDPAATADDLLGDGVKLQRRDAWPDRLPHRIEGSADQPAGDCHLLDLGA